jgi:hypothetical protein
MGPLSKGGGAAVASAAKPFGGPAGAPGTVAPPATRFSTLLEGKDAPSALHPAARHAARLAPPSAGARGPGEPALSGSTSVGAGTAPTAAPPAGAPPVATLEDLMPGLVRRVAWSGDSRRGALRLVIGSGGLAGASLLVQATAGRVDVTLGTEPGTSLTRDELEAWRDRIAARLEARGFDVGVVEVGEVR